MDVAVKNLEELPPIMTVNHVMAALGISRVNAYALVKCKDFPAARVTDRRIVIPRTAFLKWLEAKSSEQV